MTCNRHIADERCPFCGGIAEPRRDIARASGRLSRAAVFAGALALPGCSGAEPTTTAGQPAHPAAASEPAPSTGPSEPAAARSGDAGASSDAPATTGELSVLARLGTGHRPLPSFMVQLVPPTGDARSEKTDITGHARFMALAPGEYTIVWYADAPQRRSPRPVEQSTKRVTVAAGTTVEAEVIVNSYQDHPVVTPYGAPSARRRLV
jgi:hypothetical protein